MGIRLGGGLAIGRYLRDHPEAVAGKRCSTSRRAPGCAHRRDARGRRVRTAADIDPFSVSAIGLNARANHCRVAVTRRDVLDDDPPDADVILAGDCWYEAGLAERVLPWLLRSHAAGIDILVGDPGRRYLPTDALMELAAYDVRTTTELEDLERKQGRVYRLRPAAVSRG